MLSFVWLSVSTWHKEFLQFSSSKSDAILKPFWTCRLVWRQCDSGYHRFHTLRPHVCHLGYLTVCITISFLVVHPFFSFLITRRLPCFLLAPFLYLPLQFFSCCTMSRRTSTSGSIQIGLSASLEKGLYMIGSGQEQSSSIYRQQPFSWDRLRATMAGIRGLQADGNRTIGEVSNVDEADYNEALFDPDSSKALPVNPRPPMGSGLCMTRRPPSAYFAPGSDRSLKLRASASIPAGQSISEVDRRFSTASAIPAGLKLKPYTLPATIYDGRPSKAPTLTTLHSIPQSPQNAVIPSTLRRSEGRIAREYKQVTFTPRTLSIHQARLGMKSQSDTVLRREHGDLVAEKRYPSLKAWLKQETSKLHHRA